MTSRIHRSRRTVLAGVASLAATALLARTGHAAAPALAPTPRDAEGPFYPARLPAEADHDLARMHGRAQGAKGTLLYLEGRVLGTDGRPLAGTKLELWQCDATGHYHHVGVDAAALDAGFQGYGVAIADAQGRFAFRTIRPVRYGGRPPHLHFKLAHPDAAPLTTQLYPRGESAERGLGFGLSDRSTRERLEFVLAPAAGREPGALAASYDFVLRGRA